MRFSGDSECVLKKSCCTVKKERGREGGRGERKRGDKDGGRRKEGEVERQRGREGRIEKSLLRGSCVHLITLDSCYSKLQ